MSDSVGFVAVFDEPFTEKKVTGLVRTWLERFDKLEQVCPGPQAGTVTLQISKTEDVLWENHLQFRALDDVDFSWIYLTLGRRVIETTGLSGEGARVPLEVLMELPGLQEVVDQKNERRLDELEEQGIV